MEKMATREAYGLALAEFGDKYDFLVLDADLSKSTKTDTFKKKFPERFINCGIAEGNMMSVAAGIASTGKTVFASSFAMFAAGRAFEPIRNSIGYTNMNVKIAATHAGVSLGEDGATHQCNEDIALMRAIPGMTVLCPSDAVETRWAVEAAIQHNGPVYIRLGRLDMPYLFAADEKFEIGKGKILKEGKDVAIVATGLMTHDAVKAAELLAAEGISAKVINIGSLKPIDSELLCKVGAECGCMVTAEEHVKEGGLFSAVMEAMAGAPVPTLSVHMEGYGRSGKPYEVLEFFHLTAADIAAKAKEALKLKK